MKECIVKAEKLTKIYRLPAEKIQAVKDVDMDIYTGDFIAIMGPSGSGKTTLLDSIGCLTTISSGKLFILGRDVSDAKESTLVSIRRRFISFVFQDFLLIPALTALENVLLPLYFAKMPQNKKRAVELLEKVGLGHRVNHLPTQLSGGEKQRASVARALVISPKLLLADEPTGNLDTKNAQGLFSLFRELNSKEGLTILIATHNQDLASATQRTINLRDGKIVNN
jgi:ABC-type lipoprotein export system ATPase subunit